MVKHRLRELGLEQKDLAAAAQVTESYISQLLARKKAPPAPNRTDIYERMGSLLRLPAGELAKLADLQRRQNLRRQVEEPPQSLFRDCRELVLRKCEPARREQVRSIFEKEPFGELERLVTQKLLDVAKRIAREELDSANWVHLVARLSEKSYEEMRVTILEFLDAEVFNVSVDNCVSFLDPLIDFWDIDLASFSVEIVLSRRLTLERLRRFEFVETEPEEPSEVEPGLEEFLKDPFLSGDATKEEIEFLEKLKLRGKRPTPLYYYRELQNLRDPIHFRAPDHE